jgi:hypothetical protein
VGGGTAASLIDVCICITFFCFSSSFHGELESAVAERETEEDDGFAGPSECRLTAGRISPNAEHAGGDADEEHEPAERPGADVDGSCSSVGDEITTVVNIWVGR